MTITCIFLIPESLGIEGLDLFLNGKEITLPSFFTNYEETVPSRHAILFDLKLDQCIKKSFERKPELYEAFKNNEWNHLEFKWEFNCSSWSDHINWEKLSSGAQMGIHVSWEGGDFSDMDGDVVFNDPYITDYLNASLSEKKRKQQIFNPYGFSEKDVGATKRIDERRE